MSEATGDELIGSGRGELASRSPNSSLPRWQGMGLAAVVGLAIGALALIGQGHLPGAWNHLVNTGGPWLVGAFFIGALMPSDRWAAAAGLVTLLGCLLGYYVAAHFFVGASADSGIVAFWVGTALVGGPLFGLAGHWWRDSHDWRRLVGAGLLGAVIVAEGIFLLQVVMPEDRAAGWVEIAVGVIVPLLLGRSIRDRLFGLLALLPALLLGLAGFALFVLVYTVLFY
jgi:hypothetical protein